MNEKKAAEYFKAASDGGCDDATNELANYYYEGAGVEKNLKTARELFEKAAEVQSAGDLNVASMMICGEGGSKDIGGGISRIERVAEEGDWRAVERLAEIEEAILKVVEKWPKVGVFNLDT